MGVTTAILQGRKGRLERAGPAAARGLSQQHLLHLPQRAGGLASPLALAHLVPGVQEHDVISSQVFLHELAGNLYGTQHFQYESRLLLSKLAFSTVIWLGLGVAGTAAPQVTDPGGHSVLRPP